MSQDLALSPQPATFLTVRLKPGEDFLLYLRKLTRSQNIQAGFIASAVGSLSKVGLRYAGRDTVSHHKGCFEIIALSGTLEKHGEHIHLSIADENGQMQGGHAMEGCIVRTTLELVIGIFEDITYQREHCELSGYDELTIHPSH